METVVSNANGSARKATINGHEYIVVPLTMIVPGVLNGSNGPLLYTGDVFSQDPSVWNGMPVTVGHPEDGAGNNVSARSPEILDRYGIGWVFNTGWGESLTAEAWINPKLAARFDETLHESLRLMPRLLAGRPVEISTGLFTALEEEAGTYNGRPYDFRVVAFKPDHLAILPDQQGACAVRDGCGANVVNAEGSTVADETATVSPSLTKDAQPVLSETCPGCKEQATRNPETGKCDKCGANWPADYLPPPKTPTTEPVGNRKGRLPMDRNALIAYLTKNCKCWNTDKGKQALNLMEDAQLKTLKDQHVQTAVVNAAKKGFSPSRLLTLVRNDDGEGGTDVPAGVNISDLGEMFGITIDPANDPVGYTQELTAKLEDILGKLRGAAPEPVTEPGEPTMDDPVTGNRGKAKPKGGIASLLQEHGTPQDREIWATANAAYNRERTGVIDQLTKHLTGNARNARAQALAKRPLPELKELLDDQRAILAQHAPTYLGAGGGYSPEPTGNTDTALEDLPIARIDWTQK